MIGMVLEPVIVNVPPAFVAVHVHDMMSVVEIAPRVPSVVMEPESVHPDWYAGLLTNW